MTETIESMPTRTDQLQFAQALVEQARSEGVELIGPGGLLTGLTNMVLETALEVEMTEHPGYDKHDPMGRNGGNSRNGTRPKTVVCHAIRFWPTFREAEGAAVNGHDVSQSGVVVSGL
jgi:hypothetical protein